MDQHHIQGSPWELNCDYPCLREDLVAATLKLVQEKRVVVIRATPQVGKTTLLYLLGRHILFHEESLEPIYVYWRPEKERKGQKFLEFLNEEATQWRRLNSGCRPNNPNARNIFLIDEAQNSYEESGFWDRYLKNRNTRSQPLFVLVCVYGETGTFVAHHRGVYSEAIKVDPGHRIELRPSITGQPYMLFTSRETDIVLKTWALLRHYHLGDGVREYIHAATDGHPGMVGLILAYFDFRFPQLNGTIRRSKRWTPEVCHEIIADRGGFVEQVENGGRGLWTSVEEAFCLKALSRGGHANVKYIDVVRAMQEVAAQPSGLTRIHTDYDAFAFCHRMGFLHTESLGPRDPKITFVFASPIHRRVAYRRLFPGPDPDAAVKQFGLLEVCLNAIRKISPSAVGTRNAQSQGRWIVPEAAFQDEMYRCLHHELRHLPILSEYTHTSEGRIDFYIYDKKWGVEILQSGSNAQIMEHAARFRPGGRYSAWNILDDYIILNFCPKSKLQDLKIEDTGLQSRILQVVTDACERTAEVYTIDRQLKATFTLGEGGQSLDIGGEFTRLINEGPEEIVAQMAQMGEEERNAIREYVATRRRG